MKEEEEEEEEEVVEAAEKAAEGVWGRGWSRGWKLREGRKLPAWKRVEQVEAADGNERDG